MAEKIRRTVALSDSADSLLQRVGDRSAYLSNVVELRWQAWTEAHRHLVGEGWRPAELLAACDALNGVWLLGEPYNGPGAVALELADAAALNGLCAKWDVAPQRWRGRVKQIGGSAALARALCTLVQEFWLGNDACEAAIRKA